MSEIIYGEGLYNSDIKKHAKEYLAVLPKDVTLLVSMGSSGCAIASAMLALSRRKLQHLQYRKSGDTGHSKQSVGVNSWGNRKPFPHTKVAIVDDLISTGKTMKKLIKLAIADKLDIKAIIVSKVWSNELLNSCQIIFANTCRLINLQEHRFDCLTRGMI